MYIPLKLKIFLTSSYLVESSCTERYTLFYSQASKDIKYIMPYAQSIDLLHIISTVIQANAATIDGEDDIYIALKKIVIGGGGGGGGGRRERQH